MVDKIKSKMGFCRCGNGGKWQTLKVSEFAYVIGGGTPATKIEQYWNGSIPWLTPKDLSNHEGRYISKGERYISKKGLKNSSARILPAKTVLLTSRAPVGYVAIAENEICTNQGFRNLAVKDGFDSEFVYYLLLHNTEYLKQHASGSTFQELSGSTLKELKFRIPPFSEQRAIACILGSLDDKIELNRQMNKTLEAMAQAIFKSWFIDFDPVIDSALMSGNPIPEKFTERTETRLKMLDQNQPSPPTPLPKGEGSGNYRGGYVFPGLLETARELKRKQTPAEEIMWAMIRNRNFMGLKFRRQHQIGDYIADFYCHEPRLVIELDGDVHHKKVNKDAKRDSYMQSLGLKVLRFPNSRIFEEIESVLTEIAHHISPSPSGRGGGEGSMDEIHRLFPDSFEDSELGEIPKGWGVSKIKECCRKIQNGGTPKRSETDYWHPGTIPWLTSGEVRQTLITATENMISELGFKKSSAKWLPKDSTVVALYGATAGQVALISSSMTTNQAVCGLIPKPNFRYFNYLSLDRSVGILANLARGSAQQNISKGIVETTKIIAPNAHVLASFDQSVLPLFDKWVANLDESNTLASLRDTLLPKLISGELRVRDAEKLLSSMES